MNEIQVQARQINKPRKVLTNPPRPAAIDFQSRILMPCEKPSKLIEDILEKDLFPPLMKEQSRTKSVPYRVKYIVKLCYIIQKNL